MSQEVPMLGGVPMRCPCKSVPLCSSWPPLLHYRPGVPASSFFCTSPELINSLPFRSFFVIDRNFCSDSYLQFLSYVLVYFLSLFAYCFAGKTIAIGKVLKLAEKREQVATK